VIAVASDAPLTGLPVPWLDANQPQQVADFVMDWLQRPAARNEAQRGAAE
jgi:hypothetical protein